LLGFGVPIAFALVVEEVIPWSRNDALLLMSVALGITALGQMVTHLIRGRVLALLSIRAETSMQGQYFHRLLHLSDAVLGAHTSGDLLQRSYSLHDLRTRVSDIFLSTLLDAFTALFFFVSLLVIAPAVALWLSLLSVAKIVWAALMRSRREEIVAGFLRAEAEMYSQQVEMIGMLESIKAMGREDPALSRWSAAFGDKCRAELEQGNLAALLAAVHVGTAMLVPVIVVAVAGASVMRGELSIGSLFAVSALAPGFMSPLANMIGAVEELSSARSVARRVNQILGAEPEEPPDKRGLAIRLQGRVSLREVDFQYSDDRLVVDGLNLDIEPGSMVAIVGPTGSGKSTLVKLLTGLRKPARGTVELDGHDLQSLSLVHTRRQIGLVPQRVQLMRGSMRDNIAFGLDVSDAEIEAAAKLARLHERIVADPYGYAAPLSEGGSSLSGGEAQRLAIARAIVARPRLLILDEATSALDAATEVAVHEGLAGLDCTKIVIAHRLSTIRSADRIIVMDGGRVVEEGSHELLMRKRGFYAALVAAQSSQEVAA
jgi:ABC-type bacteriocin/lantibiotic exporter with double-glycine peptidase domain